MVYVQWGSIVFNREQGFRGREETNLLVHAWHSKLFVFSFILLSSFLSAHSYVMIFS